MTEHTCMGSLYYIATRMLAINVTIPNLMAVQSIKYVYFRLNKKA